MARKTQKKASAKAARPQKSGKRKVVPTAPATSGKTAKKAAKAVKSKGVKSKGVKKKVGKKKPAAKAAKKPVKKSATTAKPAKKKEPVKAARASAFAKKKTAKAAPVGKSKAPQPSRPRKAPSPARKIAATRRKAAAAAAAVVAARKRAEAELAARKAAERQAAERQAQGYEKAVGFFNSRKFARALGWFEKVAQGPEATLRHRAQVHARICAQRVNATKVKLKTVDDYYNYAVQLINDRELEEAERCLDKALRLSANADYIHYAASVVQALRGDAASALKSLGRAIELNGRNRVLARTDADLSSLRDHPSWTELISSDAPSQPTF